MTEKITGIVGEFPGSSAEGPEKTKPEEAIMKISLGVSCTLQSRVDPCVASWTMKMLVLSFYSFLTASLLTLNFAVLSALPEPPVLAPRRGVTRRWRRQRFLERCQMRRLRLMELVASY
eukprot:TRINITY_DN2285_c0_g1_i1.p1 TRINITY_DN2285_c0_g1~~TRINITY_DN2285_c0_g1_i1.p1  ORF type:complete len:139 (+),score=29.70 TRINITY_DN2285_c0_g1_i1:62-418(+)